jgi:hypothetical protein
MLATVNALRLSAAAVVALALAPALLGSSCDGPAMPDCAVPSLGETAVDGGPDPCHCDPPSSLDIQACPCLSGTPAQMDLYNACVALAQIEMKEAGAD